MHLILAKIRSVLKASANQVRGYSLSCSTFVHEKACSIDECRTCKIASLVRNFNKLVDRTEYVDGYCRKYHVLLKASLEVIK